MGASVAGPVMVMVLSASSSLDDGEAGLPGASRGVNAQ
jgi:hypothetical protein